MSHNPVIEETKLSLDTLVDDFGCFRDTPASIKHTQTGQYILCNGNLANRDGIPIEDYLGLTAHDVEKIMGWKKSVTTYAVDIDQKISSQKLSAARYNQVILAHDKSVVIEEVFKKAVFGDNDQVAAILAYADDITQHAHPRYLFSLYTGYYSTQEAIKYFLHYKNLDTAFEKLPTYEELLTLLAMRDMQDTYSIAQHLHYSASEVERYQAQLSEKTKVVKLDDIVTRFQWYPEDAGQNAVGG